MTEIERRALLGDARAQEECARQGIALPCPLCAVEVTVNEIPPHKHQIATTMPDYAGGCFVECVCGYSVSGENKQDALKRHNTRPAPPINLPASATTLRTIAARADACTPGTAEELLRVADMLERKE